MKRYRLLIVGVTAFIVGIIGGVAGTHYCHLLDDFPRVMALRLIISDNLSALSPKAALPLLDIYESKVRRQPQWFGKGGVGGSQELANIALQRYVVYWRDKQPDLAEKALYRAAALRGNRTPTSQDVEFERQLAKRLFSAELENKQ